MFDWLKCGAATRMIRKYRIADDMEYRNDSGLLQTLNILLGMTVAWLSFAVFYDYVYSGNFVHNNDVGVSAWICTFVSLGLVWVQVVRIVRRLPVSVEESRGIGP